MLEYQHRFRRGLCSWVGNLYNADTLNTIEFTILMRYVNNNRPTKRSSIDAYIYRNDDYYWEPGNIKPRIKWIKYHIKKLS